MDSLVRMYNGTLNVQSQIGHGTTVTVKLPLAKATIASSSVLSADSLLMNQVDKVKRLLKQCRHFTFSTYGFQSGPFDYLKKSLLTYLTQWFGMTHDVGDRATDIAFVIEERLEIFLSDLMIEGAFKPSLIIVVRYVPNHSHASKQSSAISIPLETLTIPFGPWKLSKTLLACLSPKQSRIFLPISEPKYIDTSPLATPNSDIHGPTNIKPATEEILPVSEIFPSMHQVSLQRPQPRILCVDDNPINLRLLKAYFRRLKFDITCAENGAVAFKTYRRQPNGFDLVFMGMCSSLFSTDIYMFLSSNPFPKKVICTNH